MNMTKRLLLALLPFALVATAASAQVKVQETSTTIPTYLVGDPELLILERPCERAFYFARISAPLKFLVIESQLIKAREVHFAVHLCKTMCLNYRQLTPKRCTKKCTSQDVRVPNLKR